MTDEYLAKSQAMLVLTCLDAVMLFGHLWDRIPTVQVAYALTCVITLASLFFPVTLFFWGEGAGDTQLQADLHNPSGPLQHDILLLVGPIHEDCISVQGIDMHVYK